jgi:hypothetical protein
VVDRPSHPDVRRRVAVLDGGIGGVRDSKNPIGPALVFTSSEWCEFSAGTTSGEFNFAESLWSRKQFSGTAATTSVEVNRERGQVILGEHREVADFLDRHREAEVGEAVEQCG